MRIADIFAAIEKIAPLSGQASWDKSGVQVAAYREEGKKLALALDPTPATISQALERGADCILTHHPLSLSPDLPRTRNHYHEVLSLLFRKDVPLYAAHTSLDVQPDGPAGWLAQALCLTHPQFLEETGEHIGFGLVGDLPKALSLDELLTKLAGSISLSTATLSGPHCETIRRVAYCTGSGSSLLGEATEAGADIFITGDVKHHVAIDATIALLDVGHHSLEEEMMRVMSKILTRRLPEVEVFFVPSASPFRRAVQDKLQN